MKRLVVLVIVLGLCGGGAWIWTRFTHPAGDGAAALPTHVVGRGLVELTLRETGLVQPHQVVAVKSKVSGRIREIRVTEGEAVRAGDLLAVVEPDAAASVILTQKRTELRRLHLEVEQREREWRRQEQLHQEGLVPAQARETVEHDWRAAQSFFLQARLALNLLEREANQPLTTATGPGAADPGLLTDYRILSPIDGVVASVRVKPGELATSGTTGFSPDGALLMEIADERSLEVLINVNEIDVARVKPGMSARVTLAARPREPLLATVTLVAVAAKTADSKLIVYPVVLSLAERPLELRLGMSAQVDLTLVAEVEVLRIPVLAYAEREGKTWVSLRAAQGFVDREVSLGLKGDRFVAVSVGLAEKDVIAARYPPPRGGD